MRGRATGPHPQAIFGLPIKGVINMQFTRCCRIGLVRKWGGFGGGPSRLRLIVLVAVAPMFGPHPTVVGYVTLGLRGYRRW